MSFLQAIVSRVDFTIRLATMYCVGIIIRFWGSSVLGLVSRLLSSALFPSLFYVLCYSPLRMESRELESQDRTRFVKKIGYEVKVGRSA